MRLIFPRPERAGGFFSACAEREDILLFCCELGSPPWWKSGGVRRRSGGGASEIQFAGWRPGKLNFSAGGMLPTAHGWRGAKHRPGSVHSYSFPQCERQHWFSIGLPEKRTYLSNSKFIYFLLCRSGRGRPPLFFSRKEKGERNDKGLRPLTPSRSTYTSDSPSAQSPREAYLVALLRRQQKAAWRFPRKLSSRSDRYVS